MTFRIGLRLTAWTLLYSLAACSDPEGDPSPPEPGYIGEFQLARVVTNTLVAEPSTLIFSQTTFAASDENNAPSLDAGGTAGMIRDEDSIDIQLIRRNFMGEIFYQRDPEGDPLPESDFVYEANYDLWAEGSEIDGGVGVFLETEALTTPGSLTVTAPDLTQTLTLNGTEDLTLQWTGGGEPADLVQAYLTNADTQNTQSINASDTGEMTIPASTIQALGEGSGTLTLWRVRQTTFELPDEGTGTAQALVGETGPLVIDLP